MRTCATYRYIYIVAHHNKTHWMYVPVENHNLDCIVHTCRYICIVYDDAKMTIRRYRPNILPYWAYWLSVLLRWRQIVFSLPSLRCKWVNCMCECVCFILYRVHVASICAIKPRCTIVPTHHRRLVFLITFYVIEQLYDLNRRSVCDTHTLALILCIYCNQNQCHHRWMIRIGHTTHIECVCFYFV